MAKPRRDPPPRHMPLVSVPPGWQPPAMLPGDSPGDWDCAKDLAAAYATTLDRAVKAIRYALDVPSPPWWKFRARRRWRDRVPLGFQ